MLQQISTAPMSNPLLPTTDAQPEDELTSAVSKRDLYREERKQDQVGQPITLFEYLKRLLEIYRGRDTEQRDARNTDILYMLRYYDNDMFGDYINGIWTPLTLGDGDFAYSLPLMKSHVDSQEMMLLKTNIEYEYNPRVKANSTAGRMARMIAEICEDEIVRLWTAEKRQREIKWMLIGDESYRQLEYVLQPTGDAPPAESKDGEDGEQFRGNIPEHVLDVPDPMSVQRDYSAKSLEDSEFIVIRDTLSRKYAEHHYQMRIPRASGSSSEQDASESAKLTRVQQDAQIGSAHDLSHRTAWEYEPVTRERVWLAPHAYADFFVTDATETPDGVPIPPNSFLGDLFPDGLFIVALNGEIAVMRPRAIKRVWSKVMIGLRPAHGTGSGLQHIRSLCDLINDLINLKIAIANADGRPIRILDGSVITTLPQANKIMIVRNKPANISIHDLMHTDYGAGNHPIVDQLVNEVQGFMSEATGSMSSSGSTPEMQKMMGTATGITAFTEIMNNRMLAAILLIKDADIQTRFQIALNIQEYLRKGGDRTEFDERFGTDTVDAFIRANLKRDVLITAKKGTDQPQSSALVLSQLQIVSQIAGSLSQTPYGGEIMTYLGEMINLPIAVSPGANDKRNAEYRLNRLKEEEKKLAERNPNYTLQPADAASALVQQILTECEGDLIAVDPDSPVLLFDHLVMQETLKDWLMSEAGHAATPVMKEAVAILWQIEFDRNFEQAMLLEARKAEVEAKIQEQIMNRQKEMQAQQMKAQKDQADTARGEALEEEGLRLLAGEFTKDADAERQMKVREHDSAQTILENEHQQLGQIEQKEAEDKQRSEGWKDA